MSESTVTKILIWFGILSCLISVPAWATGWLSEWAMIGVTLVLSCAALWYAAYIAERESSHSKEITELLHQINDKLQ